MSSKAIQKLTLESVSNTFIEKFRKSAELGQQGDPYVPRGYSRNILNFGPQAIFVESGEGPYITTVEGHRLLDLHNCFSASVVGHNHPKVTRAIQDMTVRGFSFGNPMAHESELGRILCDRIRSVEKVIFSCSASESAISALRVARANTGRSKIAKFEGGYHGMADEFMMSLHPFPEQYPGPAHNPIAVPNTAGIPPSTRNDVVILPQNDTGNCTRILRENAGDLACVIIELQTAAGGVVVMDKAFVQALRETTRELGILLIVDETVTLRANYHGMQALYDIDPDLTVMGKMIGGGLPIGALGGKAELFEMSTAGLVYHAGTHHGHPMSTAAGIACMGVMDEAAYARLNGYGDRIRTELGGWAEEKQLPFNIYGIGSHLGYEISSERKPEYKSCREMLNYSNEEYMQIFAFELANRGMYPMFRGQIALSEPMSDDDISGFIQTSKDVLEGMFVD